jgi:hypothetical protein
MTVTSKRCVWLPVVLTVVCAVSYLVPLPAALFPLHLERLSSIGAPGFVVFLQLAGLTEEIPVPYSVQQLIASALLILLLLCWFTFILLPFWRDYRVFGLSLRSMRWIFAVAGVVITFWCWLWLGGWRVHDA